MCVWDQARSVWFFPELQAEIFPPVQHQADLLSVVTWLGVLFLLIVTGFETDIRLILQKGKGALLISAGGILIPFSTGLGMGWVLPALFLGGPRAAVGIFIVHGRGHEHFSRTRDRQGAV